MRDLLSTCAILAIAASLLCAFAGCQTTEQFDEQQDVRIESIR